METKKQTKKKTKEHEEIKEYLTLPVLEEEPVFMEQPLILTDASGKTRINFNPTFALVASLTLTVKDVFRFAEQLDLGTDSDVPGEQML